MSVVELHKGLDNIIVKETVLSYVDGERGRLYYVGYPIEELVEKSTYEEVCFLLLHRRLPKKEELASFDRELKKEREIPKEVIDALNLMPRNAHPMDLLKAGIALLALYDPELNVHEKEANIRKSIRLISKTATLTAYISRYIRGLDYVQPSKEMSHAANFLHMVTGEEIDELSAKVMDVAFILHAEHELPASSMAALTAASTLSDLYSAILAGVAALKGPLHGGANEKALEMILEIGSPERAEQYVIDALRAKKRVMGFGHRVYKSYDPRARIFRKYLEKLSEVKGNKTLLMIADEVEKVMTREMKGKGIFPNIDFYSGSVFTLLGIPKEIFTPFFATARVVGWAAHVLEYWEDNRLIRPRARYSGPLDLQYPSVENR